MSLAGGKKLTVIKEATYILFKNRPGLSITAHMSSCLDRMHMSGYSEHNK